MIHGVGVDIVNIERIEKILKKSPEKFLEKYFTAGEIELGKKYKGKKHAAYFAKRFAAKEAAAKALGTGFGKNLAFKDIEVTKEKSGKVGIKLHGKAAKLAKKTTLYLSLSDEYPFAVAMVVAA
jgi:holo-[acyl-carrier protein] synthase